MLDGGVAAIFVVLF